MNSNVVFMANDVLKRSMRMMLTCHCHYAHALVYSHALSFPQGAASPLAALKHARMYRSTVSNGIRVVPINTRYQQKEAHTLAAVHWRDAARQAEPTPPTRPTRQKKVTKDTKEKTERDEPSSAVGQRSAPPLVGHNLIIDAACLCSHLLKHN